jgi:hypothetical protein
MPAVTSDKLIRLTNKTSEIMQTLITKTLILLSATILTIKTESKNIYDNTFIKDDTTRIKVGNKKIIIIEVNNNLLNISDSISVKKIKKSYKVSNWRGVYVGVNSLMTYDNKTTLPMDQNYLEIDYSGSLSFGLNIFQKSVKIIPNHLSITTGLGFHWRRFGLKNNNTLAFNNDSLYAIPVTDYNFHKNVLKSTFVEIPLLIDINTHKKPSQSLHISFGVIGAYKLGSRLKQKYTMDGKDYKDISKGHYHLNPLQAYLTARIGLGNIMLFANYGLLETFDTKRAPQNYPFTIGMQLLFD